MSRSPRPALLLLPCALLLTACGSSSDRPVVVRPMPDAGLLLPCQDPALIADPDTATDTDVALERIRVAEAYVACRRRHADLVTWVRDE
jgi:hypothetical protein